MQFSNQISADRLESWEENHWVTTLNRIIEWGKLNINMKITVCYHLYWKPTRHIFIREKNKKKVNIDKTSL